MTKQLLQGNFDRMPCFLGPVSLDPNRNLIKASETWVLCQASSGRRTATMRPCSRASARTPWTRRASSTRMAAGVYRPRASSHCRRTRLPRCLARGCERVT